MLSGQRVLSECAKDLSDCDVGPYDCGESRGMIGGVSQTATLTRRYRIWVADSAMGQPVWNGAWSFFRGTGRYRLDLHGSSRPPVPPWGNLLARLESEIAVGEVETLQGLLLLLLPHAGGLCGGVLQALNAMTKTARKTLRDSTAAPEQYIQGDIV